MLNAQNNLPSLATSGRLKMAGYYLAMIVASVLLFQAIRMFGDQLSTRQALTSTGSAGLASAAQLHTLARLLLALSAIIAVTQLAGKAFAWLNQPPVIGEVIGGILLGPSLLGGVAPGLSAYVLPASVAPYLSIIAQIGIILYMFTVGLDLDLRNIYKSGHATLAISHASIILPFVLGSTLALFIYPIMGRENVEFTVFALFVGVSMSVTAFPVLARILTDCRINKTRMGSIALTCAAIDDVTAWCLLAFVVSIAEARVSGAIRVVALTIGFIALTFTVVQPVMKWLTRRLDRSEKFTRSGMTIILFAMLLSSLATETIGIHAIFGAFLLGAVIPCDSRAAVELTRRLEDLIAVLLLPAFFAFTGMRTQIGLISGAEDWLICGAIILVASVGKFGGSFIAARLTGFDWRNSSALGILMNTRGLVELIVLNIGLDMKVIGPRLFTMLVIMAIVTTFITTPIFHLLTRNDPWTVDPSPEGSVRDDSRSELQQA